MRDESSEYVTGTDFYYEESGKCFLDGVEIVPGSLEQYTGNLPQERLKYQNYSNIWFNTWEKVEFYGVEIIGTPEKRCFWKTRGDWYAVDALTDGTVVKAWIISHGHKKEVLPDSIRQYFWRNGLNKEKSKMRLLYRAKLDTPSDPLTDGKTVYSYGDPSFTRYNTPCCSIWCIKKGSVEQLISQSPEVWVPLKYSGKRVIPKEPDPPKKPKPATLSYKVSYVYVMKLASGITKIGFTSKTIEERIRGVEYDGKVKVLENFTCEFDNALVRRAESEMHTFFKDKMLFKEYFNVPFDVACKKLSELAKEYENGNF